MRGPLHRYLERHFRDNPLLPYEMGLAWGRWWKSPFILLMALAVVPVLADLLVFAITWNDLAALRLPLNPRITAEAGRTLSEGLSGTLISAALIASAVTLATPPVICARAWSRERDSATRTHLATTLLTGRQLIGARTLLWMIPPATLFLGLAAQILLKTIAVWAFAPRLSYLWSMHMPVRYSLSSLPDPLPFIALLREGALELFQVFLCGSIPLAVSLCACALASRLAMAGRTAFTASLLALIAGAAALLLSLGLGRRFSVPWHAGLWEPWVQFGGSAAFLWIVTSVTLWRLRRQVAELYGMRT